MNIFFAGTPEIAVPALKACARDFDICGVLTNPDRPSGRKGTPLPPPVKTAALNLGLEVFQPETIDEDFLSVLRNLKPDILVTFAYGKIFRKNFLEIFKTECINIHPSLLPRHRGPSPLSAAILEGDSVTGISVQKMALKMDSGDILAQYRFPLDGTETLKTLTDYTAAKSAEIITAVIEKIINHSYTLLPQDESAATYCSLVNKNDGLINWNMSAEKIDRMFRAYYPWPGIFTYWNGKKLSITECRPAESYPDSDNNNDYLPGTVLRSDKTNGIIIKTGTGNLQIRRIKPEARTDMDYKSFLNGNKNFTGSILGS